MTDRAKAVAKLNKDSKGRKGVTVNLWLEAGSSTISLQTLLKNISKGRARSYVWRQVGGQIKLFPVLTETLCEEIEKGNFVLAPNNVTS